MPPTHPTTLTFTQGGTPLEGASITLFAQETANAQWSLSGVTDSKGTVKMQTQGFDGVPEGNFKVTVTKQITEGTAATVESSDLGGSRSAASGDQKSFHLVEKKYRSAISTDLVLEVKPGKNMPPAYDLGPAVREEIIVHRD